MSAGWSGVGFALLVGLGVLITAVNAYLSFGRFTLEHLFHRHVPNRRASGIPLFGSIILWIAAGLVASNGHRTWAIAIAALSLFDTGGLHWFLFSQWWMSRKSRERRNAQKDTKRPKNGR